MSKNGLESALQTIEYQKKVQNLKFEEAKEGRRRINQGQLSIAADRGIIRINCNTNSLGYNKKMKMINERLSSQIMNKYKNKFSLSNSKVLGGDFLTKDTIKMVKNSSNPSPLHSSIIQKNNPKAKKTGFDSLLSPQISREERIKAKYCRKMGLLNSQIESDESRLSYAKHRGSQPHLGAVNNLLLTPSVKHSKIDDFLKSYKKCKVSKNTDKAEMIKEVLENIKSLTERKEANTLMREKARSLPEIKIDSSRNSSIHKSKPKKFRFKMSQKTINSEIMNIDTKIPQKQESIFDIDNELPDINLETERRPVELPTPTMLPLKLISNTKISKKKKNFSPSRTSIKKKAKKFRLKKIKVKSVLGRMKIKKIKKSYRSQLDSPLRDIDDTPGVYRQFQRGLEGKPSGFETKKYKL
ncbi:unnamed protein product [Moneuplotes crassus]|uniref:Uncharacterized protein n=1 Tax=Euplotes crassus TaxID=5936 RepID=A0AAD1UF21_EUPCR|nr:unnamed protein product [Moneuplotes crassus]